MTSTRHHEQAKIDTPERNLSAPRVADLMSRELITLREDKTVKDLYDTLKMYSIRHVPVVNFDGELTGLVTKRDFLTIAVSKLAHLSQRELNEVYAGMSVKDIMGRKLATVTPDIALSDAAEIMYKKKFGCLPVVEKNDTKKIIGIITEADFVRAFHEWKVLMQL